MFVNRVVFGMLALAAAASPNAAIVSIAAQTTPIPTETTLLISPMTVGALQPLIWGPWSGRFRPQAVRPWAKSSSSSTAPPCSADRRWGSWQASG
jgi:hypothetical protein